MRPAAGRASRSRGAALAWQARGDRRGSGPFPRAPAARLRCLPWRGGLPSFFLAADESAPSEEEETEEPKQLSFLPNPADGHPRPPGTAPGPHLCAAPAAPHPFFPSIPVSGDSLSSLSVS